MVLMSPVGLTLAPELGSLLVRGDGSVWAIKCLDVLAPDGTPILYELWVRQ